MSIKANFPAIRPTLNLDFAGTKRLDPRISFSRSGSGATYVDANGVIQTAAANVPRFDHDPATGESLGLLIEEARTNRVAYSEQFDNAYWSKSYVTITPNAAIAPDGKFTADKLISTTDNQVHYLMSTGLFNTTSSSTLYVKAAELNTVTFRNGFGAVWVDITANLSTGTFTTSQNGGGVISILTTVQKYPNNWWKFNITSYLSGFSTYLYIYPGNSSSYVGDGTSGVYIWGAQVEEATFPTSYIPTPATFTGRSGTATYYDANGTIQTAGDGVARSNAYLPDSNGVMRPAGLLLEAASTNLLNGSATFATSGGTQNNWVDTNITRDGTLRTSPDGTANALRVTASSANATIVSSAAIGSSALRTFSIFLRRVTGTGDIQYTLDNGSTWTTQAITTSWRRYSFPATTADQQVGIRLVTSGDAIELWGAQLEASPYATSYVPTTTATVTRAADVSSSSTVTRSADVAEMTGTNFSSWYNQSAWSVLAQVSTPVVGDPYIAEFQGDPADMIVLNSRSNIEHLRVVSSFLTTGAINAGATPIGNTPYRIAFGVQADNYAVAWGGNPPTTDLSGIMPVKNQTSVNLFHSVYASSRSLNGRVSRFIYWPTRLTNTQLQTLTR